MIVLEVVPLGIVSAALRKETGFCDNSDLYEIHTRRQVTVHTDVSLKSELMCIITVTISRVEFNTSSVFHYLIILM